MNYYIATDKFGNYDLSHYGVKGMEWGNRKADMLTIAGAARAIKSAIPANKQTAKSYSGPSSQPNKTVVPKSSKKALSPQPKQQQYIGNSASSFVSNQNDSVNESSDIDGKIAEATSKYQDAMTNLQMIARSSLVQGVSLGANPDYLSARKELVKAKFELDKLNLDKQIDAAKNPPTYAEQKANFDKEARAKRAEDKQREVNNNQNKQNSADLARERRNAAKRVQWK